jgi:hypothetical protein
MHSNYSDLVGDVTSTVCSFASTADHSDHKLREVPVTFNSEITWPRVDNSYKRVCLLFHLGEVS